eukprot:2473252-Rhodomonas_salina.2
MAIGGVRTRTILRSGLAGAHRPKSDTRKTAFQISLYQESGFFLAFVREVSSGQKNAEEDKCERSEPARVDEVFDVPRATAQRVTCVENFQQHWKRQRRARSEPDSTLIDSVGQGRASLSMPVG